MPIKVMGAGFGRTGTNSMKTALEMLGFGPCHHMHEVRKHPEELHFWQAAVRGEAVDWDAVFAGYNACVDWPSAFFWREIAAHFPEAKVLLTVRPEDAWFRSINATIYKSLSDPVLPPPGIERDRKQMVIDLICRQQFDGRLGERDHAIAVYRAHNAEVQRSIAPERLLTYNVAEGWEPLCRFLDVPIPDEPFPLTNTTAEFQARIIGQQARPA